MVSNNKIGQEFWDKQYLFTEDYFMQYVQEVIFIL